MSIILRVILLTTSISTFVFVIHKMKKARMQVFDAIVWILFSIVVVIISVFPHVIQIVKGVIGIESTVNCVFLLFIFFLIIQVFSLSVRLSLTEYKLKNTIEYFSVMNNVNGLGIIQNGKKSEDKNVDEQRQSNLEKK